MNDRNAGPRGLSRLALSTLIVLHVLPFASRPALIGGDEPHYALMAHSIAVDGDLALEDEYEEVARGASWAGEKRAGQDLDRHFRSSNGETVFAHPVGLPFIAAPLLAVQQALSPGSAPDLVLGGLTLSVTFAALIAGIHLLGAYVGDHRIGAVVGLAVYFSTPLWFYSRIFMTEPYIWAWSVLAVCALRSGRWALASVFLGLCLAMKETAAIIVVPILVSSVAVVGLRRAWPLFIGPGVFGALFSIKNVALGVPVLSTFQPYQFSGGEGLVGFLVDPRRGLLWFAPLLLIGVFGVVKAMRSYGRVPLCTGMVILVSYYVLAALWIGWRGGSSYGPRLLVPVLPVLAMPLVALVALRPGKVVRRLLLAGFVAGFVVNLCAVLRPFRSFWSASILDLLSWSRVAVAIGVCFALGSALVAWRTVLSPASP